MSSLTPNCVSIPYAAVDVVPIAHVPITGMKSTCRPMTAYCLNWDCRLTKRSAPLIPVNGYAADPKSNLENETVSSVKPSAAPIGIGLQVHLALKYTVWLRAGSSLVLFTTYLALADMRALRAFQTPCIFLAAAYRVNVEADLFLFPNIIAQ